MSEPTSNGQLIWWPERKLGYFPVEESHYDMDYFEKYKGYADTAMGAEITLARIKFVKQFYQYGVVDVGVGCGQFVESHGNAKGFDVNQAAKAWLEDRGLWCDIYNGHVCKALTFWDSLEHIKDAKAAVARAREFVFVSIPIFEGPEHVLRSKHFRKDEHYWYFTHDGLVRWFQENGFECLDHNKMEQALGREDIGSYAFRRSRG